MEFGVITGTDVGRNVRLLEGDDGDLEGVDVSEGNGVGFNEG